MLSSSIHLSPIVALIKHLTLNFRSKKLRFFWLEVSSAVILNFFGFKSKIGLKKFKVHHEKNEEATVRFF